MKLLTFQELCNQHPRPKYSDLLRTTEWYEKRQKIIIRDGAKCTNCNKAETDTIDGINFRFKIDENAIETIEIAQSEHPFKNGVDQDWVYQNLIIEPEDKPYNLQIHHTRYIKKSIPWEKANPWECSDDDLVTLCNWCHSELHNNLRRSNQNIPVYTYNGSMELILITDCAKCSRCDGKGYFEEYKHVLNGECFKCGGSGYDLD